MVRPGLDTSRADERGGLRSELVGLVREHEQLLSGALVGVAAERSGDAGRNCDVDRALRSRAASHRRAFDRALDRAVDSGDLDPVVDPVLIVDLLVGPVWSRLLRRTPVMTREDAEAIVGFVLDGIDPPRGSGCRAG